ncbi:MAG: glycosyltransferase [Bacteroidales bacterium]|jgi:hypothetical protein|nr:glycosyltransferase [Bacteroidales bacterium]
MNRIEFMKRLRPITFPFALLRDEWRFLYSRYLLLNNPRKLTEKIYFRRLGIPLDLENPKNLNEKINWLKLYSDTSRWTELADKHKVRDYVAECGFENMLVPLYGVFESVNDIDFNKLPESFVLKPTNASGIVLVVPDKNKIDFEYMRRELANQMSKWPRKAILSGEFHYLPIKPRIIAEKFLEEKNKDYSKTLIDYKIWCFNGEPFNVFVCSDRTDNSLGVSLFDMNWTDISENLVYKGRYKQAKRIPKPVTLDEMISACKVLSKGFPQVRIDFYEVNNKPYIGEMTFTSYGGRTKSMTSEYLLELGERIVLPPKRSLNKVTLYS